ncbi:cyclase family protein [Mucilaginibacter sp. X4EP1]|uniref:cyclase family protein n=1 Tax=Mucilaginibacter sp. X4EP1 TaxID=2723092 RepID=UPI0021688202|nr:cyclase family protein [Mucilaginibacter sp. X4EP1]MCS3811591.1 kynurenine formamidase [Mucilaginibacter sp. X4EP1]
MKTTITCAGNSVLALALVFFCSTFFAGCENKKEQSYQTKVLSYGHLEDLTYTLTKDFPYIHVHKLTFAFQLKTMATLKKNGVNANTWIIHEHLGTHVDAPNHFQPDGISVDQIKPEDLIVPLIVIDIRAKAAMNRDAELTVSDIEKFEEVNGRIKPHSCVMMLSGWGKYVKTPVYMGIDGNGNKHFPGFSVDAVKFLAKNRAIAGIGADVISFDPGIDNNYSTHKMLFSYGKWAVENVANLEKVPVTGAILIVGAPKIGEATGGIARIFAVW